MRLAVINSYFDMIGWFGLDYKPLEMLWTGAFFPEKMTSLEILDMSFILFDVFSQYLELDSRLAVRNDSNIQG